jgi:hypothetical protein
MAAVAQVLTGQVAGRGGQDFHLVVEAMFYLFGAPERCLRCGISLRKKGAPPVVMKNIGAWLCERDSPLGPQWVTPEDDEQRPSHLLQLTIAQVLEGRRQWRSGDDHLHAVTTMTLLFGLRDDGCLVCGEISARQVRSDGKTPKDVDSWFCHADCPVCDPVEGRPDPRHPIWPEAAA